MAMEVAAISSVSIVNFPEIQYNVSLLLAKSFLRDIFIQNIQDCLLQKMFGTSLLFNRASR